VPKWRQGSRQITQHLFDVVANLSWGSREAFELFAEQYETDTGERFPLDYDQARSVLERGGIRVRKSQEGRVEEMLRLIEMLTPIITQMTPHLVFSRGRASFVTSDAPVVKHDPDPKRKALEGIGWRTPRVEASLPLTSHCCLVLDWSGQHTNMEVGDHGVAWYNHLQADSCMRFLVSESQDIACWGTKGETWWGPKAILRHFQSAKCGRVVAVQGGPLPQRPPERFRR